MIFNFFLCKGCSSKSKTKKIMYDLTENEDFDREEIPTYEVKLYNLSQRWDFKSLNPSKTQTRA